MGISLRESLHNFGSLWRQSPTHMDREDSLCAKVGNSGVAVTGREKSGSVFRLSGRY